MMDFCLYMATWHTLMVVYTSTRNLWAVWSNTQNRPTCQTITDRGIAMIPLPEGAIFRTGGCLPPQKKKVWATEIDRQSIT